MEQVEACAVARELCARAMSAELEPDKLQASWPAALSADVFGAAVLEDLEDAIEHVPGYLFRRSVNWAAWRRSPVYWALQADTVLLADRFVRTNADALLRSREALVRGLASGMLDTDLDAAASELLLDHGRR